MRIHSKQTLWPQESFPRSSVNCDRSPARLPNGFRQVAVAKKHVDH
jgi:hypothetical protein